jgi:hypothetical protein
MLAPDGMLLCNTDLKKANWYLKNDKAELIQQEPMIIKLKFQPSGFQVTTMVNEEEVTETQFITTVRINQCVVCGDKQHYLKYNVSSYIYIYPIDCATHVQDPLP